MEMGIASIQNTSFTANDSQLKKVFTTIAPNDSNYRAMHLRMHLKISVRTSLAELEYDVICIKCTVTSRDIFNEIFGHIYRFNSLGILGCTFIKISAHYHQKGVRYAEQDAVHYQ